jgi:hypothetical protein
MAEAKWTTLIAGSTKATPVGADLVLILDSEDSNANKIAALETIPTSVITTAAEAADTTCYPVFVSDVTGSQAPKTNGGLSFNAETEVLTATGFAGPLTGDVTGTASGNTTSASLETRLGGANAPSSTELSYVKNLASSAQQQIADNLSAITTGDDPGHGHSPPGVATSRLQTIAADATSITPDADNKDCVIQINECAEGTLTLVNPSGTPVSGQPLRVIIYATVGEQTMAYGALYASSITNTLPTTIPLNQCWELGLNYIIDHWYIVALARIL